MQFRGEIMANDLCNEGERYYPYNRLISHIDALLQQYKELKVFSLGKSLFGRDIPVLKLGEGNRNVLYVGTHHSMESVTSLVLMRFVHEYLSFKKAEKRVFGFDMNYLYRTRSIFIVPMLNPDGVELCINGVNDTVPIGERLIKMNNGSADFSAWQANGRGVDLNHNYNAGFSEYKALEKENGIDGGAPTRYSGEYPESEPETSALCRMIRIINDFDSLLTFHSQGREIYYDYNGYSPKRGKLLGKVLERMSGYKLSEPSGLAGYGGLKDWFICEYDRPAYTIECGYGENPLLLSDSLSIYTDLMELLFSFPLLVPDSNGKNADKADCT